MFISINIPGKGKIYNQTNFGKHACTCTIIKVQGAFMNFVAMERMGFALLKNP